VVRSHDIFFCSFAALTVAGNATRMAYNIGLNMDCSSWVASGHISEEEAEVRNVTWWGCYTLDK
jgi:hypothetical protein